MKTIITAATLALGVFLTGCGVGYNGEGDESENASQAGALRRGGGGGGSGGDVIKQRTCDLYTDKTSCFADPRCQWIAIGAPVVSGNKPGPSGSCFDKTLAGGGGSSTGGTATGDVTK